MDEKWREDTNLVVEVLMNSKYVTGKLRHEEQFRVCRLP